MMNKYFLTFRNQSIEDLYQNSCRGQVRLQMFGLIVLCLVLSFIGRIIQGSISKNFLNVAFYAAAVVYVVVQYYLAQKYQKLLRISLILLNHVFTIFLILVEESMDPISAYLRGVNQMGSNFLILLAGEYSDAMFSLISIQIIRIFMVFLKSQNIEYFAIFSTFIFICYASKQLHMYHKALRSQFLLSLKEKQWDNILNQILKDNSHLLLSFDEEELKFKSIQMKNCQKLIKCEENFLQFLRDSKSQGKSLESIIFQEIKKFNKNYNVYFNSQHVVIYEKNLFSIEFSIFYGNQPTILLIIKSSQLKFQNNNNANQIQKFIEFILRLCTNLQKIQKKNGLLKIIERKFIIQKLQLNYSLNQLTTKRISILKLLFNLKRVYYHKDIRFQTDEDLWINSSRVILNLFFLNILESTSSKSLKIDYKELTHSYELKFQGKFNGTKYNNSFRIIKLKQTTLQITQISKYNVSFNLQLAITFQLFKQSFVPIEL